MSKKEVNFSTDSIRPANGYGPILRPTARETYSLRQQIFELVRASGRIARSTIARTLDISPGSVTSLTAELIVDGFLREVEETASNCVKSVPQKAVFFNVAFTTDTASPLAHCVAKKSKTD